MSLNDAELQKLRETARSIGEQAIKDPAYKEKLRSDPAGTLAAAGIPAEAIPDVMHEAGLSDVAGYAPNCVISCPVLSVSV